MNNMIRRIVPFLLATAFGFIQTTRGYAQDIIINPIVPSSGVVQKEQLWNLVVVNPGTKPINSFVSLSIVDKSNGQAVLSAVTNMIIIPTGSRQLQVNDLLPITYTSGSPEVNTGAGDFLPPGRYQICYRFSDGKQISGNSCVNTVVSVLAPPQLIFPENKGILNELNPFFSWIPPVPGTIMKNGQFTYRLVKVNTGQQSAEAINDNIPVYTADLPSATFLNYPSYAANLVPNQVYAWQIIAGNSHSIVKSDVWTFTIKDSSTQVVVAADTTSFSKLSGDGSTAGYALSSGILKFELINPSLDSLLSLQIIDVSQGKRQEVKLKEDFQLKFLPGKNLVTLDLKTVGKFVHRHLYQLEITDKKNYLWRLLFKYQ